MRSLYFRIFMITLTTIILSSFLGFLVSNIYYHIQLKPQNDAKLITIAKNLQGFIEANPSLRDSYLDSSAALGYEIYLADDQGNEQFYGSPFRELDLAKSALLSVLNGETYHGVAQFPNKPLISGFFDNRLSNSVGIPIQLSGKPYALFLRPDVLLQFGELRSFFAMIVLFTVVFSVILFLLSTRYLVNPITRLTEATKRLAQGYYNIVLPTKRRDEIGQLAVQFMTMSREIERSERSLQEFVSNVSHEIQSPLTSIQGFAQVITKKELPSEERDHYAGIIEEESRKLSVLSKQLLLLSSLDQATETLQKKPVNLRVQLKQVAQAMEWQLEAKELALRLVVPENIVVNGDEILLYQVWLNLLSNAVKYIPVGSSIHISANLDDDRSVISISDTGEGIAAEELPFLFDRFYRVDRVRDRESGSAGLGLSIVQKIVKLHEGTIEVESTLGQGTKFTVSLPHL
ncbi:sensor histidine kinase [Cohnella abietis]|uniref:Heme sensor protein HssS n=1 Tax=Cohnella abietis TaxID=2507935 RepID=A0A3T1CYI9_9BACL|nr:HAMP domain-containing sensor histidine kinase [Cohnella abietis]BBI30839.1 two-component sensor histidine kinase [Cohnella abietis]